MIFRNRIKNPRTMMVVGNGCLVIALSSIVFLHPTAKFGPELIDGVRGMLFGISIGANLVALRTIARQRHCS
ncbi:MAG TPA: hypothetical protein VJO53_10275 [Candidatus Acidoferrales bacterium]|nr:hypothetical protein [Candidatus Acidoferrales bacterium]